MEPLNNLSNFSQPPAFSLRQDEKSTPITTQSPNQMKGFFLTADGSIKILLPPTSLPSIVCNDKHRSKDVYFSKDSPVPKSEIALPSTSTSDQKTPKPINLMKNLLDEDEDFSQFKLTPKNTFMATICHVGEIMFFSFFN